MTISFLTTKPRFDKPSIDLRLGIYGPPQAGKTTAFHLTKWDSLMRNLPSGMEFGVDDPREFNANKKKADEILNLLWTRGLPATEVMESETIDLFDAERCMVSLRTADPVGQVFSQTGPDSAPEDQQRFEEQRRVLVRSDVLWFFLPMPPRDGSPGALRYFETQLKSAKTYLRAALRRPAGRTCSLAIVLSKMDLLAASVEQARQEFDEQDLVEAVQPLVSVARASEAVLHAAILPISAVGFGKALPRLDRTEEAAVPIRGFEEDEQQYVLVPGVTPEPFNTLPLVVLSMAVGMLSVEVEATRAEELKRLYERLRGDLACLDGWVIPVKGHL